MASKTDICNFALSHLGISTFVANIETDSIKEARVCKKWWPTAIDYILRNIDWNFNRRYIDLAPLAGTVPPHWTFKYVYPPDCLMLRAIMPPGIRYPMVDQRIVFEVAGETDARDIDNRVIYTDLSPAVARYSRRIDNVALFSSDFVVALSYLMASFIAMPLTAKPTIAQAMQNAYMNLSQTAMASNFNESQDGPEPDTLARVRDGSDLNYRNG